MANTRMRTGHWYKMKDRGQTFIGQYMGTECGFPCCVCEKGYKAKVFNIYYEAEEGAYQSWGFGAEHMPELLEDLGDGDQIIVDKNT